MHCGAMVNFEGSNPARGLGHQIPTDILNWWNCVFYSGAVFFFRKKWVHGAWGVNFCRNKNNWYTIFFGKKDTLAKLEKLHISIFIFSPWNPTYGEFWPKFCHFWGLRLFHKKKTSKIAWNHLCSKVVSKKKTLKPLWNYFGYTKTHIFPKSVL